MRPHEPIGGDQPRTRDTADAHGARGGWGKITHRSAGKTKPKIVTMPEYEPLSHPGRTEDRKIRLLPTSTCSLSICIEDIPWLVRWLSDELRSGGVPLPKSDPLDALECNCDADNVHIRWDFNGAWEAIILQDSLGRAKRGMKYKCVVSDFDQDKWLAVGANARYGTDFERARPDQNKEASKLFLEKHRKVSWGAKIQWHEFRSGGSTQGLFASSSGRPPQWRLSYTIGCSCGCSSSVAAVVAVRYP